MKNVGVAEAKNNLSRYLSYVRRGGRVRIFDRVVPVADLVPVESGGEGGDDDAALAALERRGVIRRGKRGRLPKNLLQAGPLDSEGSVVAALLDERRNGR